MIVKLFDANVSSEIGYNIDKKCICELNSEAPLVGSYRVIYENDYWGFISTRNRDISCMDDHFFSFIIKRFNISITLYYR